MKVEHAAKNDNSDKHRQRANDNPHVRDSNSGLTPELSRAAERPRRWPNHSCRRPRPRSGLGLNESLAEKAAQEPCLRLYRKSRKGSGTAFGPGRQAAFAILLADDPDSSSLQFLKA